MRSMLSPIAFTLCLALAGPADIPADPARLAKTEKFLTSSALEGRFTGSPGLIKAQAYIVKEVKGLGLQPYKGSYEFEYALSLNRKLGPANSFRVTDASGKSLTLSPGTQFSPLGNSAQLKPVTGKLAWLGYGLAESYEGLDVKGRIVVCFRGPVDAKSKGSNQSKIRLAKDKGAVGIVFVGPYPGSALEISSTASAQGVPRGVDFVAVSLHQKAARAVLGTDLAQLAARKPALLEASASIQTDLQPNETTSKDIVAVLPGTDPKLSYETIIIGAHLDHLGYAETGSLSGNELIHPGADDNASGSATILEMARMLAKTHANRRTIIFQWYSGEELGLLGSEAWAKANTKALSRTHVMLNLDMVGRLRKGELTLFATNSSESMDGLTKVIEQPDLKLIKVPTSPSNSDHYSFFRRKVPCLFATTGLHEEYHTERDVFSTINIPGMATVANSLVRFVRAADAIDAQMTFNPNMSTQDSGRRPREGSGRRIRTGFIPDMAGTGPGMLISGTVGGSPAEKAGIKEGDRLMKFGDMDVKDVEDLANVLSKLEAGKTYDIIVIRDGKELHLKITPEAAPGS